MRFGMGYDAWTGGPRGFGRGGHHHGDDHGPGGMHRGGGRRRLFDSGELRLVLLKLIADGPRHGYDLIRALEELTGGAYAPSPGVVYPTITMLDDMALIEEQKADGARKAFAATEAGRAYLAEQQAVVDALFERIAAVGERQKRTDGAPIRRAMGNLRAVLQNRLGGEEVAADKLHEIAALIDEAAQKIERL